MTEFSRHPGSLANARGHDGGVPRFTEIELHHLHQTCKEDRRKLYGCLTEEKRAAWCARRPDQVSGPFCTATPTVRTILRPIDHYRWESLLSGERFAEDPALPPLPANMGEVDPFLCNQGLEKMAKERGETTRYCRVLFLVAPSVKAEIDIKAGDSATLVSIATEQVPYVRAVWEHIASR